MIANNLTNQEVLEMRLEVERLQNQLAQAWSQIDALTAERDAALAAAKTWKQLAKRYRGACAFLGGLVNERDAWIAGMARDLNAFEADDASR